MIDLSGKKLKQRKQDIQTEYTPPSQPRQKTFEFSEAFWIAWDDLIPSMESAWKQAKWKSKYNMIRIVQSEMKKYRRSIKKNDSKK